jgi:hypothetical protein
MLAPAAVAALMVACSDITSLEEKPPTFISPGTFFTSDANAVAGINGVYQPLLDWNLWRAPAEWEVMCDDPEMLCWNWMGGGFAGKQGGQWYAGRTYTGNFQIINRANDFLANISKGTGISAATKKTTAGQALFARGMAYFELARRYGGVPIRTEPYVAEGSLGDRPRSPVNAVFAQAAKDLRAAADSLPATYATSNGQGRPRAATAWGLLSKVYLHMAGAEVSGTPIASAKLAYYDSARVAAQMVMSMPSSVVALEANYMDVFDVAKQNTSPEILFAVQGASAALQGADIINYFSPQGDCTIVGGCGQGFVSLREDFYATFDKTRDKRVEPNRAIAHAWENTFSPFGTKVRVIAQDSLTALTDAGLVTKDVQFRWDAWTEGCGAFGTRYDTLGVRDPSTGVVTTSITGIAAPVYSLKYKDPGKTASTGNSNNIITLRYADVLLVFAEAENEVDGPTVAAYDAINQVRQRANLLPLSGLTQAQFRQAVWDEREHELYGEFQAKFDLIREGRWLALMNRPSTLPQYASNGICRPREAYQQLNPLPAGEIASNQAITQNPGY